MQKRWKARLLGGFLIAMTLLSGCLGKREPVSNNGGDQDQGNDMAVITGTIINKSENSIMILENSEDEDVCGLYGISIKDALITDDQKETKSTSDLVNGMLVNVYYDGQVQETYPGQINGTSSIEVVKQTGDVIGMYLNVIKELYEEDAGLNSEINTIALDFTKLDNLKENEKAALEYLVRCEYGFEVRRTTIQELQEEGLIKDLYYDDGIVFILSNYASENNKFGFKAQKWRSGLGAIGYDNCSAEITDGIWQYTLSGAWIS